jgi:hypothetical protein
MPYLDTVMGRIAVQAGAEGWHEVVVSTVDGIEVYIDGLTGPSGVEGWENYKNLYKGASKSGLYVK